MDNLTTWLLDMTTQRVTTQLCTIHQLYVTARIVFLDFFLQKRSEPPQHYTPEQQAGTVTD